MIAIEPAAGLAREAWAEASHPGDAQAACGVCAAGSTGSLERSPE